MVGLLHLVGVGRKKTVEAAGTRIVVHQHIYRGILAAKHRVSEEGGTLVV